MFPNIQPEHPLAQPKAITSHPITVTLEQRLTPISLQPLQHCIPSHLIQTLEDLLFTQVYSIWIYLRLHSVTLKSSGKKTKSSRLILHTEFKQGKDASFHLQ